MLIMVCIVGHPGVDPGFSEGGGGGGANDGKGEWGVPPPTQSREAFAIIVCQFVTKNQILCHLEENQY